MMICVRRCAAVAAAIACGAVLSHSSEPTTVITGEEMEIRQSGKKVIFSGNSKVVRGDSVLTADTLIQDKKADQVEASGNVRFKTLTRDGEPISGNADKAVYNLGGENGRLSGNRPTIVYEAKTSTGPLKVAADIISFDQKAEEVTAEGRVEIHTSSGNAYAPRALLRQKDKKIVLSGAPPQPIVVYVREGETSAYAADTITYEMDRKRVMLEGSVHGILRTKELEHADKPGNH